MDIYFQNGASADIRDLNSYEEEVLKLLLKLLPDDLRNVQVIKYILDQSMQKTEALRLDRKGERQDNV